MTPNHRHENLTCRDLHIIPQTDSRHKGHNRQFHDLRKLFMLTLITVERRTGKLISVFVPHDDLIFSRR